MFRKFIWRLRYAIQLMLYSGCTFHLAAMAAEGALEAYGVLYDVNTAFQNDINS